MAEGPIPFGVWVADKLAKAGGLRLRRSPRRGRPPGLLQRAARALRPGGQASLQTKAKGKSILAWPRWKHGKPQWGLVDLSTYIKEGFNANAVIYAAIMYKVRAISSSPLRVYGGDLDNPRPLVDEQPDHPLVKLVARPNAFQSWMEFQQRNIVFLNLAGESFIYMHRRKRGDLPDFLLSLRPDRIAMIPGADGTLQGWKYYPHGTEYGARNEGYPIVAEDMMAIILPNPADPFEGMGRGFSPVTPLAQSADVDNHVTEFLKLFFEHGAMPPGLLTTEREITPETAALMRERWQEIYGSFANWADVAVLGNDAKYQRLTLNFDEMGFKEIDERNESRILAPFGVPPMLIGTRTGLARSTFSNWREARAAFWEDTMIPELRLFEVEYQYHLRGADGAFVRFDTSGVPALQKDVPKLTRAARDLFLMGAPAYIAYQATGLPIERYPGDDVSYVPSNMLPQGATEGAGEAALEAEGQEPGEQETEEQSTPASAEQVAEEAMAEAKDLVSLPTLVPVEYRVPPDADRDDEDEDEPDRPVAVLPLRRDGRYLTFDQKQAFWKQADETASSSEGAFADAARQQFEADRRACLAAVDAQRAAAVGASSTVNLENVWQGWVGYFSEEGRPGWRERFVPLLEGVITQAANQYAVAFGVEFDVRNLFAEAWFTQYTLTFADPICDTSERALSEMLQQAQREGWSIDKLHNRVDQLFRQWMTGDLTAEMREWIETRTPAYRIENIVRTEAMRALNAGSQRLFQAWGATHKEWLATMDARTRETHMQAWADYAEGGTIGPIPIDQPFIVAGYELMHPLDTSMGADLSEICNCRCVMLPWGMPGDEL